MIGSRSPEPDKMIGIRNKIKIYFSSKISDSGQVVKFNIINTPLTAEGIFIVILYPRVEFIPAICKRRIGKQLVGPQVIPTCCCCYIAPFKIIFNIPTTSIIPVRFTVIKFIQSCIDAKKQPVFL